MTVYVVACRTCGVEFEPDRRAILAGSWRLCPTCRETEPAQPGPAVCPNCHRVLKSGKHRGACPGRGRRRKEHQPYA